MVKTSPVWLIASLLLHLVRQFFFPLLFTLKNKLDETLFPSQNRLPPKCMDLFLMPLKLFKAFNIC